MATKTRLANNNWTAVINHRRPREAAPCWSCLRVDYGEGAFLFARRLNRNNAVFAGGEEDEEDRIRDTKTS